MPFSSPQSRQRLLYMGVGLNAFAVFVHTQISITKIFPLLDKSPNIPPSIVVGVKNCLLLASASWVTIAILQLKMARHGMTSSFDKTLLVWYSLYSVGFGVPFWRAKAYLPLVPLWLAPAVTALSQF